MTKTTKIIAALGVAAGLGIAALPSGAIFADADSTSLPLTYGSSPATTNVTVQLTVGEAIAIAVDSDTCAATATIGSTATCAGVVAAGTNVARGFKIEVTDADSTLELTSSTTTDTIAAVSGTLTGGMTGGGWNITGGSLTSAAITTGQQTVHTQATAGVREVNMTYNFATAADQAAATYSDTITYTATVNPVVNP